MADRAAGQTAIITGARRGIGLARAAKAAARELRRRGRVDEVAMKYPLGRLGTPGDVFGSVVAFRLSADAAWMTGRTPVIDGGLASAGGA
ncbi:hypothetical protein [Streptomyces sp. 15-116A]|uniref:hypothetical protein n=1 Tax=Streptomyces sp. 15-116A TaxID=2259035 RepID=UPI0028C49AEE|nr:hypothetical protein [Streptomyces sp. 15-116A]